MEYALELNRLIEPAGGLWVTAAGFQLPRRVGAGKEG